MRRRRQIVGDVEDAAQLLSGQMAQGAGNVVAIATSTSVLQTPGKNKTGLTQMVFKDCAAAEVILELIGPQTP